VSNIVKTIEIPGFDPEGEPEIHVMQNGDLNIVFCFMPPSDFPEGDGMGVYEGFDRQMADAIGLPVVWEDRERFLIQSPNIDTIIRLRDFIAVFREKEKATQGSRTLSILRGRTVRISQARR